MTWDGPVRPCMLFSEESRLLLNVFDRRSEGLCSPMFVNI